MAGKEDPVKNFGAVGGGSSPAEKVEAGEAEIKVGTVPSAFMPVPLPSGRHKRGTKKADSVSGLMLRSCSGSHTAAAAKEGKGKGKKAEGLIPCAGLHAPTEEEEEEEKADLVSVGMKPCTIRQILAKEDAVPDWFAVDKEEEEEVATGGKRKAQESGEGKAAVDATQGDDAIDDGEEEEWMEMPMDYLAWILSKTTEDVPPIEDICDPELPQEEVNRRNQLYRKMNERVQAANHEFSKFQKWVRETLEKNGRVMIPADTFDPAPELDEQMNQVWRDVMEENGVDVTKLP